MKTLCNFVSLLLHLQTAGAGHRPASEDERSFEEKFNPSFNNWTVRTFVLFALEAPPFCLLGVPQGVCTGPLCFLVHRYSDAREQTERFQVLLCPRSN